MAQVAERKRRHGKLYLLLMALAAAGAAIWVGSSVLSVEEFAFTGARLPAGWDGGRLVVLSDLHGKRFGRQNSRLLEAVRGAKPDVICLCGDMMDEWSGTEYLRPLLEGLAEIAPVYYVTGNHEWAAGVAPQLEELLTDYGVTVLSNEYVMLEQGGDRIALVGAEDPNGYADQPTVAQLLDQVRAEQGAVYTILLSHRNNHYAQYAEARADLTLSGHAHGGLIRLPGTDGLIGPKRELWPAYTAGLYDLDYGQMVVSRGLGNQFPCFRLFNRPDVPLVVLE